MPLSLIGTPIGNLGDITLRAIETLKKCDVLVCEDSRMSKKLLFFYGIENMPMIAYDEHSHARNFPKILSLLQNGKHVGLISDAGMPCISDPGSFLLRSLRASSDSIVIDSVPGATAVTTALALSGVDVGSGFLFLGFPPHKKGRETFFTSLQKKSEICNVICFYESSHRILDALSRMQNIDIYTVTVARELTKLYEQLLQGSASEVLEQMQSDPQKQKGEFVVILQFRA